MYCIYVTTKYIKDMLVLCSLPAAAAKKKLHVLCFTLKLQKKNYTYVLVYYTHREHCICTASTRAM